MPGYRLQSLDSRLSTPPRFGGRNLVVMLDARRSIKACLCFTYLKAGTVAMVAMVAMVATFSRQPKEQKAEAGATVGAKGAKSAKMAGTTQARCATPFCRST